MEIVEEWVNSGWGYFSGFQFIMNEMQILKPLQVITKSYYNGNNYRKANTPEKKKHYHGYTLTKYRDSIIKS